MSVIATIALVLVGLINFAPVVGVLGSQRIAAAYNVEVSSPDMAVLLRHRALLFGVLGGFVLFSVVVEEYRWAAMVLAGVSMVGFAVLMALEGCDSPAMTKVLYADYAGIVFLVIAAISSW